jgi:hypothetical protein
MQNSLFTKNLAIHFVNDLSNETHYIYDVELENVGVDGVNYNMQNLYCSNGTNVLDLNEFNMSLIEGKTLLNEGHIVVGTERVSGVVAFEKDIQISNDAPIFEYDEVIVNTYSAQIGGV